MKILNQNPNIQPQETKSLDARNPKILAAARGYEQQFLGEMVNAMRQTVQRGSLEPESMGERIYKDQLYDQYVEQWTNVGGVGLSDLIYDQIVERFTPPGAQQHKIQKLQGPVPLDNKKTFQVIPQQKSNQSMTFKISPQKNAQNEILMPWTGELTHVQTLESGEKAAFIKHDNGLQSTFLFKGKMPSDKKKFNPGEALALLDDSAHDYTWKLSHIS